MIRSLLFGLLVAGCAATRYSTLSLEGTSFRESTSDTLAGIRIDIQGLDPRIQSHGQISVERTGPDTLSPRWRTFPLVSTIDSLPPGSYEVIVRALGYSPTKIAIALRRGEVARLVAHMRRSRLELQSIAN